MALEISLSGAPIGSVIHGAGNVIARLPDGTPLGQFDDMDAAINALVARAALRAA